jgi:hypothetical protein
MDPNQDRLYRILKRVNAALTEESGITTLQEEAQFHRASTLGISLSLTDTTSVLKSIVEAHPEVKPYLTEEDIAFLQSVPYVNVFPRLDDERGWRLFKRNIQRSG